MAPLFRALLWSLSGVIAVAAAVWFEPYIPAIVWWNVRPFLPAVMVATVIAVLGALTHRTAPLRRRAALFLGVRHAGLAIGALLILGWLVVGSYWEDRAYSTAIRVVNGEELPALAPRAPFVVGKAQAGPTLGDVTGDISEVSYLPDQNRFVTLVDRRGWLTGYEVAVTQVIDVEGAGHDSQTCRFSDAADARIGGWFGHNLGRLISKERFWVRFADRDAYAYCDGDAPIVVVPLKREVGLLVVSEQPAGVAVYNGATGTVQVVDQADGVPGPTYPISLAARQRTATHGLSGFADWWFSRSGWDASDDGANSDNDSEFTLARADGSEALYVTPLAPRGSASSVVAVSSVPARYRGPQLAPLTVYRLDPAWASPQAIVARIKADYSDFCCYNLDQVFEVIPTGGDDWGATIGSEQALRFRVTGNGQLEGPEATCIRAVTGEPIRCGARSVQQNAPVPAGDPRLLNNTELAQLQRAVADEVARRLRQQPG